jgi:chromate transporter
MSFSPAQFFADWARIGATSFGGGAATQTLMMRQFIDHDHLITHEEYLRYSAIAQLTPGVSLFAIAILIGQKANGLRGSLLALFGLALPSSLITVTMSAIYATFRDVSVVQSALRGAVPVIVGISLFLTVRLTMPILRDMAQRSTFAVLVGIAVIVLSAILTLFGAPVIALYALGAMTCALLYWRLRSLMM